jgi:hypothetical protein
MKIFIDKGRIKIIKKPCMFCSAPCYRIVGSKEQRKKAMLWKYIFYRLGLFIRYIILNENCFMRR